MLLSIKVIIATCKQLATYVATYWCKTLVKLQWANFIWLSRFKILTGNYIEKKNIDIDLENLISYRSGFDGKSFLFFLGTRLHQSNGGWLSEERIYWDDWRATKVPAQYQPYCVGFSHWVAARATAAACWWQSYSGRGGSWETGCKFKGSRVSCRSAQESHVGRPVAAEGGLSFCGLQSATALLLKGSHSRWWSTTNFTAARRIDFWGEPPMKTILPLLC